MLNAIKYLAKLDDSIQLIPPHMLEPVQQFKKDKLKIKNGQLTLKDVLQLLAISTTVNPTASLALNQIDRIKGCEAHASAIINNSDYDTLNSLGVNITMEPRFSSKTLFNQE